MKKQYFLIAVSLLLCLFIYLFYRTEKTVITQLFIWLISPHEFSVIRNSFTATITLNDFVIYSLPEGLWVFCISLTSQSLFIKIGARSVSLLLVPLIVSIGLELFQLLQFTQGRFDLADIGISILFWTLAVFVMPSKSEPQNMLNPFTAKSFICILSYLIVYLAHVWK